MTTYGSSLNATIAFPELTGNWGNSSRYLKLTNVDTTNEIANWERYESDGTASSSGHGMRIHWDSTNNVNVLYVNDDDNTSDPTHFSIGTSPPNSSSRVVSGNIQVGNTIYQWDGIGRAESDPDAIWTVTADHLWSASSGGSGSGGGQSGDPPQQPSQPTSVSKVFHNFW